MFHLREYCVEGLHHIKEALEKAQEVVCPVHPCTAALSSTFQLGKAGLTHMEMKQTIDATEPSCELLFKERADTSRCF